MAEVSCSKDRGEKDNESVARKKANQRWAKLIKKVYEVYPMS
jgi:hypothetical protein